MSVGLRTGTTRTIGFVLDTVATSRYAGDLIKAALEAARERGEREHGALHLLPECCRGCAPVLQRHRAPISSVVIQLIY